MDMVAVQVVEVARARDGWDYLTSSLGALAAFTAVVVFVQWGLQHRRRPEGEFSWWWSLTDARNGYRPWAANQDLRVAPGQTLWVRVAITNIGDAASHMTLQNMLAPASVEVVRWDAAGRGHESPREGAENRLIGVPPSYAVKYFVLERYWPAGLTWVQIYRLTVPPGHPLETQFRLGVEVDDPRFNARGSRWFWTLVTRDPPRVWCGCRFGRWPERIRVKPDSVRRKAGTRLDMRRVVVGSASDSE